MKRYIDRIHDVIVKYPDRLALVDAERSLTYHELEMETGKIYNYLKKQGVKREDNIMVCTKRGVGSVSCILGILKAGAAFIPLEEDYPKERIDYIKRDASCDIVLDEALYRKIIETEEYIEGHEDTDLHDKAYVVYTSGSTGNPKGVVHEYGNIEQEASIIEEKSTWREFREGIVSPFYFTATCQFVIHYTLQAFTMYILHGDLVRDIARFSKFVYENRIQGIFLSPSYIRLYKEPSPYMEEILAAGEPANGIYYPGGKPVIRNLYGMTESGFTILETILDKAYEIAPMGRPVLEEIDLHLEDDDGNRVEGVGTGEICFKSEYVRGYLNLPEKTREVFVDGVFHTRDIGRRDENGMYYILGRKDDMFKINGNRVEPVEIERVVKKVTGLETVVAKGFDIDGRSFICLYYLRSEAEERNLLQGKELKVDWAALSEMLPRYMLPTYYIPMEEMPLSDRGKTLRRCLPAPELKDMAEAYVPPADEAEREICEMMAEILRTEKVGAESDFYRMGGDSLRAIRLIALAGERGYSFTAGDLYRARTPRKLVLLINSSLKEDEVEELDRKYRETGTGLLPGQKFHFLMKEAHSEAVTYHVSDLHELKKEVDLGRLEAAVNKVLRAHPVYMTKLVPDDEKTVRQVYDESIFTPALVRTMEDDAFADYQREMVKPFPTYNAPLYRVEIIKTPSANYLFMDHHHLIMDGMGLKLLKTQIYECYQDPETVLPKDHYYALTGEISEEKSSTAPSFRCDPVLLPDKDGKMPGNMVIRRGLDMQGKKPGSLEYVMAAVKAAAEYNQRKDATILYGYSGRDSVLKNNSIGMYAVPIPVYADFSEKLSLAQRKEMVKEQMDYGAAYSYIQWVDCLGDHAQIPTVPFFNYQKDTLEEGIFAGLVEKRLRISLGKDEPCGIFTFGVVDSADHQFISYYFYPSGFYSEAAVEKFATLFEDALRSM